MGSGAGFRIVGHTTGFSEGAWINVWVKQADGPVLATATPVEVPGTPLLTYTLRPDASNGDLANVVAGTRVWLNVAFNQ